MADRTSVYKSYGVPGMLEGLEVLLASELMSTLKKEECLEKSLNMNFNSPTQLLAFFKIWYPWWYRC
jgi:hypothetical protein